MASETSQSGDARKLTEWTEGAHQALQEIAPFWERMDKLAQEARELGNDLVHEIQRRGNSPYPRQQLYIALLTQWGNDCAVLARQYIGTSIALGSEIDAQPRVSLVHGKDRGAVGIIRD